MSPLQEALSSIRQLTSDEKRRLRDYLNAELASTTEQPHPAPTDTTNPPATTNFGWARDFLVIRDDIDAPLEDFSAAQATSKYESVRDAMERLGLMGCVDDAPSDLSSNPEHMRGYGQDEDPPSTFESALDQPIRMTPEEQLAFWNALHAPVELTPAQRKLGSKMRGEL